MVELVPPEVAKVEGRCQAADLVLGLEYSNARTGTQKVERGRKAGNTTAKDSNIQVSCLPHGNQLPAMRTTPTLMIATAIHRMPSTRSRKKTTDRRFTRM